MAQLGKILPKTWPDVRSTIKMWLVMAWPSSANDGTSRRIGFTF